jgi:hypothetical protein
MSQVTTSSPKSISVLVIDMSHYQEAGSEMLISGFVAREEAIEYARRRVRASLEELRTANQTPEALRRLWAIYGEEAIVVGANYSASSELDHFIAQPATEAEGDWRAIEKRLGTQLHKRIAD